MRAAAPTAARSCLLKQTVRTGIGCAASCAERSAISVPLQRLLKRRDFLAARKGARAHSPHFVLQLHRRDGADKDSLRIGYTITKKIGNAVVRNRIRRRLRAAVALADVPAAAAGHDCVVIAKEAALTAPHGDLVTTFNRTLRKALTPKKRPPLQNGIKAGTSTAIRTEELPSPACIAGGNVARDAAKT